MVSTAVIIIVVVICAVLGVFLFAFVALRVVKRLASTSTPLPPVQPLAHHREQLPATLPRSQTWYMNQQQLPVPQPFDFVSTKSSSTTSLLVKSSPVEASPATSSSPLRHENSLTPPSPSFHTAQPDSSTSSLNSSEPGHSSIPPDTPPLSGLPQSWSSTGNGNSARRKRPLSISSSSRSTIYSKGSRNTLCGTPHGPHSRIEIILPTPLAGRQEDKEAVEVADRWM